MNRKVQLATEISEKAIKKVLSYFDVRAEQPNAGPETNMRKLQARRVSF